MHTRSTLDWSQSKLFLVFTLNCIVIVVILCCMLSYCIERAVADNVDIERHLHSHQLGKFCRVLLHGFVSCQPFCIAEESTKPP